MTRPNRIFSNLAISCDGKITPASRPGKRFASDYDRERMDELRAEADAVLNGSGTIRDDPYPVLIKSKEKIEKRKSMGRLPHPMNVVLSNSLRLPFPSKFFECPDTTKLIYTTPRASSDKIKEIQKLATLSVFEENLLSPETITEDLARRGVDNLLVEGGGEIMFSFLKSNLIDELFVTVCPVIIGGKSAPTMVDGEGFLFENMLKLELIAFKSVGGEVFLHYKIRKGK